MQFFFLVSFHKGHTTITTNCFGNTRGRLVAQDTVIVYSYISWPPRVTDSVYRIMHKYCTQTAIIIIIFFIPSTYIFILRRLIRKTTRGSLLDYTHAAAIYPLYSTISVCLFCQLYLFCTCIHTYIQTVEIKFSINPVQ